jgi:hypothetical protein
VLSTGLKVVALVPALYQGTKFRNLKEYGSILEQICATDAVEYVFAMWWFNLNIQTPSQNRMAPSTGYSQIQGP